MRKAQGPSRLVITGLVATLLVLAGQRPLAGQRLHRIAPAPAAPVPPSVGGSIAVAADDESRPVPVLAAAGLGGGALGLVGGFYGVNAVCPIDDNLRCSRTALGAAAAAESALMPLAVHLANGRRGSYGKALLASTAIGAAGIGIVFATDSRPPVNRAVAITVPIAQLISSVVIERVTAR